MKYKIGQDCWMVKKGYGVQLYRCFITARIEEETSTGKQQYYRVKLEYNQAITECNEDELFDEATRSLDALCRLSEILQTKGFI